MTLRRLQELDWPPQQRIAVLAPHPDDFDAIAVSLRFFHARGDEIHLAVLTSGASGVEDGFGGACDDATKAALREVEQRASCALFGLPDARVHFLRLPADAGGNPRLDAGNEATIRRFLQAVQPQLVCMPHGNDSNVTHQRSYALFDRVARADGLALRVLLNQDAKTIAMRHDLYQPFDADDAEWKAALLRLHASQHARNLNTRGHGFDERVLAVNGAAAAALGLDAPYAEVFELEQRA